MTQYVVELDGERERLVQIRESSRAQWVASVEGGQGSEDVAVELLGRLDGDRVKVRVNGVEHSLSLGSVSGARGDGVVPGVRTIGDGRSEVRRARVRSAGDVVLSRSAKDCSSSPEVQASAPEAQYSPMTGVVLTVEVEPGQRVERGQALAVIEAMKMENTLYAAHEGVVGEVCVCVGETVRKDDVLMRWDLSAVSASEEQ